MVNAQDWLDESYPKEGVRVRENETYFINDFGKTRREITVLRIREQNIAGSLDLAGFANLEILDCAGNQLTNLNLSKNANLKELNCPYNQFTSVDFLNDLPHPEKLEKLTIYNNNIQPTNIAIFSKLVNIKVLKIGTMKSSLTEGKHNKFFGSLQAYQNITKLESICIEATDVDSGLEYLPASLAEKTQGGNYSRIECSPHQTEAKCLAIQDQLRPLNYDLAAWQLANFDLILKVNPSNLWKLNPTLFTEKEQKDKLINALITKIEDTQHELGLVAENTKKLVRLESKLSLLQKTVEKVEERNASLEEELQMEREEAEKALEKAQEWRERQLKEITDRKDKEIGELKNNLETEKIAQNKLISQLQEEDEKITSLNENLTQVGNELVNTKTQLATAQNLTNNLAKTEENLSWIKTIIAWGFLALIGLQILFGIWTLWGVEEIKKIRQLYTSLNKRLKSSLYVKI